MNLLARAIGSAAFVLLLAVGAQADTIYMKNGNVLRGTIVGYSGGRFTVMLDAGGQSQAVLVGADIERIEFDASGRAAASAPYDPGPASAPADPGTDGGDPGGYDPAPASGGTDGGSRAADDAVAQTPAPSNGGREVAVTVPAKSEWTATQVRVRRGDRVRVTANGTVQLDRAGRRTTGPAGTDLPDRNKLVTNRPTGALIAVIGDDNDDFLFVGPQAEFTAQRDGMLFLSVNEGDLTDNSGAFTAHVTVGGARGGSSAADRPSGGRASQAPAVSTSAPRSEPRNEPRPAAPAAAQRPSVPSPTPAESPRITGTASSAVREADVTVPAKNDWTSTQLRVTQGSRIRISASGSIQLDRGGQRVAGPSGIDVADKGKLIGDRPTGGLIAVIGDDNDDFIFVGDGTEFVARRDGLLFLSVNEGELSDNAGTFAVHLVVEQPRASASR